VTGSSLKKNSARRNDPMSSWHSLTQAGYLGDDVESLLLPIAVEEDEIPPEALRRACGLVKMLEDPAIC
jgi:hypothetical protein